MQALSAGAAVPITVTLTAQELMLEDAADYCHTAV
jgi:hypothetical protein